MNLELLAGDIGGLGNVDGTGIAARFTSPSGVAVDSAGNVYVADQRNHAIRKVTAGGVVTTLAGTAGMPGSADGTGAAARFYMPGGVAVDSAGNVYVADSLNFTIRKVTAGGMVTTLAGTAGLPGTADGTGAAAGFNEPGGVAVDSGGNVYVGDSGNGTIRKITAGGVVTTLAGTAGTQGSADGTGAAARFTSPSGVAVDSAGNVYVADSFNFTIRKVTAGGVVTTLAGTAAMLGYVDGTGSAARFNDPSSVAVDGTGNVYVADTGNSTIREVTAGGVVTTLAGAAPMPGSVDGTGAAARFNDPFSLTVDSAGNVYVVDTGNATIRKVTAGGVVTTLAGTAGMLGYADGTGAAARFLSPSCVALDGAGNAYVADNGTIRKVTEGGVVTTLAGTSGSLGYADGTGAAARFNVLYGMAVDSAGNIYVADQINDTIRKITAGGVVTTLAGTAGMSGYADGTGAAAQFHGPYSVAVDSTGNLYVTDAYNGTIRKVTAGGVVTTLAGAASSQFSSVAVDRAGNVYVADLTSSILRKITPGGATTTVAGTSGVPGIVLGATPQLAFPRSLAIIGDSLVIGDTNAILLLRHGAQ